MKLKMNKIEDGVRGKINKIFFMLNHSRLSVEPEREYEYVKEFMNKNKNVRNMLQKL